jgi:ABC-type sugar transport system substrate-binding protein
MMQLKASRYAMLSRIWKSIVAPAVIGSLILLPATNSPIKAAGKDSVTVSIVLALAAGEWSTEILAGANAAAKDLNGKVKIRVTGPTTFDPQRQAQMFLAELETNPDILIVVNVAPPLFTQPALEAQSRGAHVVDKRSTNAGGEGPAVCRIRCFRHGPNGWGHRCFRPGEEP